MRASATLLVVLLAASTWGCYTYSAVPGSQVPDAGSLVRVQLTEEGAETLRTGRSGSSDIFGRVRRTNADSVTLSVRTSAGDRVDALGVNRDSVIVALSSVTEWRRQELSVLRTAGLVAGVAGVAVMTTQVFVSGGGAERESGFQDDRDTEGALRPTGRPWTRPQRSSEPALLQLPAVGWSVPIP